MSTWGIGDNHDSEEVRTLKEQLRTKGAQHATLHGEFCKREAELKEVKTSLDEALLKLRQDADRYSKLEAELQKRNEELSNEQYTRANAEVALTAAEQKLKEAELTTRELQSNIHNLSSHANSTQEGRSKLERDHVALQTRVRALERELQNKSQAEEAALRQSHGQSRHRRQPSETISRTPALEKELAELRAASTRQVSELERTTEQLTRTRDELVKVQNEKTASERRLQKQLAETQATLEDREEDLRLLKDVQGGEDAVARESELLERLEQEEQRVAALETELSRSVGSRKRDLVMLQDELDRATRLLEDATEKAAVAEDKLASFAREREAALRERQYLQQEHDRLSEHIQVAEARINELEHRLSTSGPTSPIDQTPEETVETIDKLLNTIQRLRGERDDLRRDLEFLSAENRFAVQSLQEKLAAATSDVQSLQEKLAAAPSAPVTPAYTDTDYTTTQGYVEAFQEQAERSARATVALAIVAQHACEHDGAQAARIQALLEELSATREALQQRQLTIGSLGQQLTSTSGAIADTELHISGLRATIQRLEDELARERNSHAETGAALSDTEAQIHAVSDALTDAEAARDALALEKTHLESDLESARQDFADAEARHSGQVAALSAGGNSSHGIQAALRSHIQELEDRVHRRTEQIGIHQHDIKRLELNMKLQEERLAELTQELEVVQNEKEAMLEDCRASREQRDDAMRRCDELEDAMEGVEEMREREVEAMVGVTLTAVAASRDALIRSRQHRGEIAQLQERIHLLEDAKVTLSSQLAGLVAERDLLAQSVNHASSLAQSQLEEIYAKGRAAEEAKTAVETQLTAAHSELEAKNKELTSLQNQLAAARADDANRQKMEVALFTQEKADLQDQLQQAQTSLSELAAIHKNTVDELQGIELELKKAEDELATHLANSAVRSEAEEHLRREIAEVRQQHAEEAIVLDEQLRSVTDELAAMSRLRDEADTSRKVVEEELAQTRQQLETRLAEAGDILNTASRLEAELEQLKTAHGEELRSLRAELDSVTAELQDVTRGRDELQALHDSALRESQQREEEASEVTQRVQALEAQLAELRVAHAQELEDLQKRLEDVDRELQENKASADALQRDAAEELTCTVEELQNRLTVLTKEADEYRMELDEEKAAHSRTRDSANAELREVIAMHTEAETALAQAEEEIPNLRSQLANAEASLRDMEEMQYQATNLEAEIQRAKSLQRFLESQVAEGERRVADLEAELEQLRMKCTTLDKRAQSTEANLAMQTIQHEQTVAVLRRELNALRSQPSIEEEIAELKEKNAEYEELLRAKCLEIEENDDKFIDMIKEKKKLNSKIDTLNRKVQTLQAKLTAATEAAAKGAEASPAHLPTPVSGFGSAPKLPSVFSPALAPAAIITNSTFSASTSRTMSRSRVVTAPIFSSISSAPIQPPPMPTFRPKTPESSRKRMTSGPSSISRPKTPESRLPAVPVFKARTPERHRVPTTSSLAESSSSSSSLIGVKRRAPDDFDDCSAVPPQMFSADSAPLDSSTPAQPTTPRLRRALQTMRTGFTPNRHTTRAGSASPRRATTGAGMSAPLPTINDVTNSPRSSARHEPVKAAKKGWLGKIKSAPSQTRAFSSRQPLFDPPGMR